MDFGQRRCAWLRRLALLTAAMVLAITSLSAFIRLSHAGLGCSQWPQCYGSQLRAARQNGASDIAEGRSVAVARLAHRLIAMLALLAIIAMVMVCFGAKPWLLRDGALVLALLMLSIGLAVLGRWSASSRIPAVTIGNLLGGLLMLALSWRLAAPTRERGRSLLRNWAWAGVAALVVQVALGALVSASYAGLSCEGLGDCFSAAKGTGWPWQMLNPWREPVFGATAMPLNQSAALVQLVHRCGALVTLLVLTPIGFAALRGRRRREGAVLLVLLILQIGLGWLAVATMLPLALVLLHNVFAGLLLATMLRLL